MNRRERRYGRMYLPPLLLGLTGIALLVLAWVLELQGAGASGALDSAMRASSLRDVFLHSGLLKSLDAVLRPNLVIFILPAILLVLYLIRIPPKYARFAVGLCLAAALLHTVIVLYCGKHTATVFCMKFPGYDLLRHLRSARLDRRFLNVLPACADGAFFLSTVSAVFTTLVYCFVKAHSEKRNAAFDERNAYLINAGAVSAPAPVEEPENAPELPAEPGSAPEPPAVTDEPTRVLELPEEFSSRR